MRKIWIVSCFALWAVALVGGIQARPYVKATLALSKQIPAPMPPGHPDEYPANHFCTPDGTVVVQDGKTIPMPGGEAHKCSCHRVVYDEMCEGEPVEDHVCRQWCFKQHCHCPVACDTTPADPGSQPGEGPEPEPNAMSHTGPHS